MISVSEALDRLFALTPKLGAEDVPLLQAAGRVLATDLVSQRDQPPFAASAMDGYAMRASEIRPGATFEIVGEASAGHGFAGSTAPGQAIRVFTGAPLPDGLDHVVIQEDVHRTGDTITLNSNLDTGHNIRPAAGDFKIGDQIAAPRRLSPEDIALLAAMNIATVPVARKPVVALISTGDELVMPGEDPGPDQIIASNTLGLYALLVALGAKPRLLPIARDTMTSLETTLNLAMDADLIVTIGGASVGDHDLVAAATEASGMKRAFYKVAMRPGKPLMAGQIGTSMLMGLPGNPVSAMVCGHIFIAPVIRAMQGLPALPAPRRTAALVSDLAPNGPREHYMRAKVTTSGLKVFDRQDSSLLTLLSDANALLVRPPNDPLRSQGDIMQYVPL